MNKKYILYLRTDIWDEELTAGGSVTHTLGVVKGFIDLGYPVVCASSCLNSVLKDVCLEKLIKLYNPSWLRPLRWKMNCLLSSFFFFFQTKKFLQEYPIACIYQRYSLLNLTGVFLARCYKKKLILEYNGSEAWVALNWIKKKHYISGKWLLYAVEACNLRYADMIVVVSNALKDELVARNVSVHKILVNPNGVDTEKFNVDRIKEGNKFTATRVSLDYNGL